MARISDLNKATVLNDVDQFMMLQGTEDKRVDVATIRTAISDEIPQTWQHMCNTIVEMQDLRDSNNSFYRASGFTEMGSAPPESSFVKEINKGLYTSTNEQNSLFLGTNTDFSKINISGVETSLKHINRVPTSDYMSQIKLPPAEAGRRTYNKATGESVLHSTAAEAFEGICSNGDFRNGLDNAWVVTGTATLVDGAVNMPDDGTQINIGQAVPFGSSGVYRIKITCSGTGSVDIFTYGVGAKDGVVTNIDASQGVDLVVDIGANNQDFAKDNYIDIRRQVGGFHGTIYNVSILPVEEEVVTERVDMWGFELFLREVTLSDPFVYQYGLIQSQSTEINGVSTVENTGRPLTYFAVYDGDTSSRGRGVDFWAATDEERFAIVTDNGVNIVVGENRKVYQWCLRQRSFAGVGNGDWLSIASATSTTLRWDISKKRIKPQGIQDSIPVNIGDYNEGNYGWFVSPISGENQYTTNKMEDPAIFSSIKTNSNGTGLDPIGGFYAVDGECYFLVCGTVNRLNQGAYHPEFNEMGARTIAHITGGNVDGGNYWYQDSGFTKVSSESQCFNILPWGSPANVGAYASSGFIGATGVPNSGHPDSRFYDAIYASGQGGVQRDIRYLARKLTSEDFSSTMTRVINGDYRGNEKLKFTFVNYGGNPRSTVSNSNEYHTTNTEGIEVGQYMRVVDSNGSISRLGRITAITPNASVVFEGTFDRNTARTYHAVIEKELGISVSGDFNMQNITGNPSDILEAFTKGFYGSWLSDTTTGLSNKELTSPRIGSHSGITVVRSDDKGGTWYTVDLGFNSITNTMSTSMPSGRVQVVNYEAKSKQTQPASNAELYGKVSIGNVFLSDNYTDSGGRSLGFSMTDSINKNSNGVRFHESVIQSYLINPSDGKYASYFQPTHDNNILSAPNNNSKAFKFLWSIFVDVDQGNIQFNYSELNYTSNSFVPWGDDNKIHIIDNDSEEVDLNGVTVRRGTHKLVEPIGWV